MRERQAARRINPFTSDGDLQAPKGLEITSRPSMILARNPDRVEAFLFNAGGSLEILADLGVGDRVGTALPQTIVIDSGSIIVPAIAPSTYKTFVLFVDTQLTWTAAGQPTVQLIVGRDRWAPFSGAATNVGGASNNFLKGAAANLGPAAATSLAVGMWPFSPADIGDLQWQWPFVGLELKFPSALTAGAARLFLQMPGGPPILIGVNLEGISKESGDRANSFILLPSAPPLRVTARRALYAMTPAGIADLRVWEAVRLPQEGAEVTAAT